MDLRKTALAAAVAGALSLVMAAWNAAPGLRASRLSVAAMYVVVLLLAASLPVFSFALYRNEGGLRFTPRLRQLALGAALVLAAIVAAELPRLIASLGASGPASVLAPQRGPWTIRDFAAVLAEVSNLCSILLLIAIYRQSDGEPAEDQRVSKFLVVATNVAIVAWGFWVVFNLVRLALTPYTYSMLRSYVDRAGGVPPSMGRVLAEAARTVVSQACLLAAPFVIWRGTVRSKSRSVPSVLP